MKDDFCADLDISFHLQFFFKMTPSIKVVVDGKYDFFCRSEQFIQFLTNIYFELDLLYLISTPGRLANMKFSVDLDIILNA